MTVVPIADVKKLVSEGLPDWIAEQPELRRRLREAVAEPPRPPRQKMTYAEFLAWADEDTLAEWVNGEVVMTSPASRQHQNIADFLTSIMRAFAEQHHLGVVLSAPFQMKLEHGREPDVLFLASEHLERLRETCLDGPADLVIEIISPESLGRDRGAKFIEYEAGQIPEFWLVDPGRTWAEFYRLSENRYTIALSGKTGVYRSAVLAGFWLRVEWLWQPPRILDVLRELGLLS